MTVVNTDDPVALYKINKRYKIKIKNYIGSVTVEFLTNLNIKYIQDTV